MRICCADLSVYAFAMARQALIILGVAWLLVIVGVLYFNHRGFVQYRDVVGTASSSLTKSNSTGNFKLSSTAFPEGDRIPAVYTCDEKQMSPPLSISGVPAGTESMALIMEDRDIPKNLRADGTFLHWVVYDIAPQTRDIAASQIFGTQGVSGVGTEGYMGPCPPPQYEPAEHRYYFTLYALDRELGLVSGANKQELLLAMDGHVIAQTELMGRYKRIEK